MTSDEKLQAISDYLISQFNRREQLTANCLESMQSEKEGKNRPEVVQVWSEMYKHQQTRFAELVEIADKIGDIIQM